MDLRLISQAVGMFVVTNVDDLVVLALFFGQAAAQRRGAVRVVVGHYLGFVAILAASILGALGVGLLPPSAVPYLGLLPMALGFRAAWRAWRERTTNGEPAKATGSGPAVLAVAAVTLANGGDNIGVYVPVFAISGVAGLIGYVVVFLVLVGVWCLLGWYLAGRRVVARALARWGHILLPPVLIGIGVLILIEGGFRRS